MGSRKQQLRPTPPPPGPALVRPAIGVLLFTLGGAAEVGCTKNKPLQGHPGDPPMAVPMDTYGPPPMPPPPMPPPMNVPMHDANGDGVPDETPPVPAPMPPPPDEDAVRVIPPMPEPIPPMPEPIPPMPAPMPEPPMSLPPMPGPPPMPAPPKRTEGKKRR